MSSRVFDPRRGHVVESRNPALVLEEILRHSPRYDAERGNQTIAELADYFDTPIPVEEMASPVKADDEI